jgi:hypothetical protein
MSRQPRPSKYQVQHRGTSGGPKFSSLWEALRYIAHCLKHGNDSMTINKLEA